MRTNKVQHTIVRTHEGGRGFAGSPIQQLRRMVMTSMLFEDTFYESGSAQAEQMAALIAQCNPKDVADLAREAKHQMYLRHVPLFIARELVRLVSAANAALKARRAAYRQEQSRPRTYVFEAEVVDKVRPTSQERDLFNLCVEELVYDLITRADEIGEFLALYWRDGKQPLAAPVKRAIAQCYFKFNEYQFAKWDRDSASVKLRDGLRMTHPSAKEWCWSEREERGALLGRVLNRTLETPDTWEVGLSAAKTMDEKRAVFERLLSENKLGADAMLKNLRNMQMFRVRRELIAAGLERIDERARLLPFRFLTAARYAPEFEPELEEAMFRAGQQLNDGFHGHTTLLVDVSGSMEDLLSARGETTRLDAACGVAIHLREHCSNISIWTFSDNLVQVPARRGFALRDAIVRSQHHGGTNLNGAVKSVAQRNADGGHRVVIVTDEQANRGAAPMLNGKQHWTWPHIINIGTYAVGVGDDNGWNKINGWSPRVLQYIAALEKEENS